MKNFDAIIVGARCSGSTTASHLSKMGFNVLVVDKAIFPQDTLSTHFVWPRGASYLNRLGVLDEILEQTPSSNEIEITIEDTTIRGEIPLDLLAQRFTNLHGNADRITQTSFSAKRYVIDKILIDYAVKQGAKVLEGFTVNELIFDTNQQKVLGIKGKNKDGSVCEFFSKRIIGADGVNSIVAKLTNTSKEEIRENCTFAAYSYFSGFDLKKPIIQKKGRMSIGIVPTNDGHNMTMIYGPKKWAKAFRNGDKNENFIKAIKYVNPEIGEIVEKAKKEKEIIGTDKMASFIRNAAGKGYALVGDAASFKDQCTASGMTHAFRDAELIAQHIKMGFETNDIDNQLQLYARKRHLDTWRYQEFVSKTAEMNPASASEVQLFEALSKNKEQANRFLAMYGDTLPVRDFFTEKNIKNVLIPVLNEKRDLQNYKKDIYKYYKNIFEINGDVSKEDISLNRTCVDFGIPIGPNILKRVDDYYEWYNARNDCNTWQYARTLKSFPGTNASMFDANERHIDGINFASQDYLSMGSHPKVMKAAKEALEKYGPHSAGSPMVIGNTELVHELEEAIAEMTGMKHVMIFPTGWAAGFGTITGLVREQDHIVMDRLAHSCLYQGAYAATKNVYRHPNMSIDSVRGLLEHIREKDQRNGIFVISEGLFSMDSETPDIKALQEVCRDYDATLMLDVAHDFGALGENGAGHIGNQGMKGQVDLVMGSFSKSFASNGGFLATNSAAVKHYSKMYSSAFMFSNAICPMQTAVALEATKIMRSKEGSQLRKNLLNIVNHIRNEFHKKGIKCLGTPSAIIPVMIGDEKVARIAHKIMTERNIATMILEYPVVPIGSARFRLQVMASHTIEQANAVVSNIAEAIDEAREYVKEYESPLLQTIDK
ncbi:aminotransferase class I/II-fold pyridoxal phosphate-dependent enzyme [Flavivirga eckloniae]|uniref:8-amino-7-oxononanoate synthase n=1 Tax=Flavivirga eckloniae TaxID=1803846 RepID=A0A2K9PRU6_9FLAO|nr:aminotransferase class I/II-fold pyridoxal phosphate-dependent enzyme [Flavivirga eckloniae]AUP79297.1 hypothetical protein C1H87_11505 [Flavivirga eckloniae]